ncbi:11234_t:CDS:2 [Diversispora eburnea]|uniref:11234_t:CDS:1 n=1 Tax=Diversispora eburnea TaxID=1213867 RepID=A0A9N8ZSZ7_9GLOM|nr:11234_t:CDS:2 [Diversispora eburnea]
MLSDKNKNITPAGIIVTETNNRIIPATRRPDGSLRKERRVRPGFIPQEDIAIYKNRFVAKKEHTEHNKRNENNENNENNGISSQNN